MLQFQNVRIQLVDTPAIVDLDMQTRLFSLLRNTDLILVVVDLSADALEQMEEIKAELEKWGYRLIGEKETSDPDHHQIQKRAILVGNKADQPGGLEQFQQLDDTYGQRFSTIMASTHEQIGLDELK